MLNVKKARKKNNGNAPRPRKSVTVTFERTGVPNLKSIIYQNSDSVKCFERN